MNINRLRSEIDSLDDKIVELFLRRLAVCKEIGYEKLKTNTPVYSPEREASVLDRLTKGLTDTDKEKVEKLYMQIFVLSKELQTDDVTFKEQTKLKKNKLKACLVGSNVEKSFSKTVHGYFGTEYDLVQLKNEDGLASFVNSEKYVCYNVTMPYKRSIIPYLDELSLEAEATGVVNTVMVINGKKWGYNTDIEGLRYLFKVNDVDLKGKNVLILGTGGTSKTAEYVVKQSGALKITFVGRNQKINYDNCGMLTDTNIIVNTTPVGMNSYKSPIDLTRYPKLEFVADVVYTPLKTKLIEDAEASNIKCVGGLEMLLRQAEKSEEIWRRALFTGENAANEVQNEKSNDKSGFIYGDVTDDNKRRFLKQYKNIVLIGMPSSGKTAVGKLLSEKLGRDFCDTDGLIESFVGKKVQDIFEDDGEEFFRTLEKITVENLSLGLGKIISTGGGVGVNDYEVRLLKLNGFIVYLDRDLKYLDANNRPLSQKYGNEFLYKERADIYEKVCDVKIDNNGDINLTVDRIIEAYEKNIDCKRT